MKSVVNCCCQEKSPKPFPKLMKSTTTGVIVLFRKYERGTIVNGTNLSGHGVSYASNDWDMNKFQDFEGSVTLSND